MAEDDKKQSNKEQKNSFQIFIEEIERLRGPEASA